MRVFAWLAAPMLALTVTACSGSGGSGSESSSPSASSSLSAGKTMPDVIGRSLDVAEAAIEAAGGQPDQVKILGGGALGVVVKSNWQVCAQSPAAGQTLPDKPELTVERSCSSPSASVDTSAAAPSSTSTSDQPITAANSADFAALLQVTDDCDARVEAFATQNAERAIEFDGSVRTLTKHGSTTTRYDILIAPGDAGPDATSGPNFQFEDVNLSSDLNFEGTAPESIGPGTKLHFVAKVGTYDSASCLLQLTPVATQAR